MILNLLPPEYKLQVSKKRLWHDVRNVTVFLAMITGLATGGVLVGQHRLQQQSTNLEKQIEALRQEKAATPTGDITTVTTKLNATISSLSKMVSTQRSLANDLVTVAGIIPANVTVLTLSITGHGEIILQGLAATRQSFIDLDEAMKKSPLLEKVKTTSTPSKRENVPFSYTASLVTTVTP